MTKLDTLEERREKLCLFAKACVRHEKLSDMFPKQRKGHQMDMRHTDKFVTKNAKTERLQRSAILNMQRSVAAGPLSSKLLQVIFCVRVLTKLKYSATHNMESRNISTPCSSTPDDMNTKKNWRQEENISIKK